MKNIFTAVFATLLLAGVACAANNATSPNASSSHVLQSSTKATLAPSEGSPMPVCQPGHNCNDSVRLTASEGSPMPVCQPGHNCNDSLRLSASEGSPMPVCQLRPQLQ